MGRVSCCNVLVRVVWQCVCEPLAVTPAILIMASHGKPGHGRSRQTALLCQVTANPVTANHGKLLCFALPCIALLCSKQNKAM